MDRGCHTSLEGKMSKFFLGAGDPEIINPMLQTLLLKIHPPFFLTKRVPVFSDGRPLFFSFSCSQRLQLHIKCKCKLPGVLGNVFLLRSGTASFLLILPSLKSDVLSSHEGRETSIWAPRAARSSTVRPPFTPSSAGRTVNYNQLKPRQLDLNRCSQSSR